MAALLATLLAGGLSAAPAQASSRPMPIGVTSVRVSAAGTNQVRVTWKGGGQTTKYAFAMGSTSMTDANHFETGWIASSDSRIRARSITLTVPTNRQAVLGAGSGNYVFVKVVQTNSTGSPAKCVRWTPSGLCRASASGSAALAGNAAAPTDVATVSVATWNVQSLTATRNFSARNQWSSRISRVAANVELTKPDLIGFQELNTSRSVPQAAQLAAKLSSGVSTTYQNVGSGALAWIRDTISKHQADNSAGYGFYVDSDLFFQPSKLTLNDQGFISPRYDLKVPNWTATQPGDVAGVWAKFTTRKTTGSNYSFIAASIHAPVGADSATSAVRRAEMTKLAAFLNEKAKQSDGTILPIVLLGDLNSVSQTDSGAASLTLRQSGYFDAAAAPSNRSGQLWSTTNVSNGTGGSDSGYPTRAVIHPYPTARIDYILVKDPSATNLATATASVSRYANLIRLSGSSFDTRYNGSDHNLQYAIIGIPAPKSPS